LRLLAMSQTLHAQRFHLLDGKLATRLRRQLLQLLAFLLLGLPSGVGRLVLLPPDARRLADTRYCVVLLEYGHRFAQHGCEPADLSLLASNVFDIWSTGLPTWHVRIPSVYL